MCITSNADLLGARTANYNAVDILQDILSTCVPPRAYSLGNYKMAIHQMNLASTLVDRPLTAK